MGRFSLEDYQTVDERLHEFWARHPEGRVLTSLESMEGDRWVVKARVYTGADDSTPRATGFAEEKIGSSPVNKTSALENAETSAIGRALANMGYSPKGKRPSREEMAKVAAADEPEEEKWDPKSMVSAMIEQYGDAAKDACKRAGVKAYSDLTPAKYAEVRAIVEFEGEATE
jgi:hypothetical protein